MLLSFMNSLAENLFFCGSIQHATSNKLSLRASILTNFILKPKAFLSLTSLWDPLRKEKNEKIGMILK